MRDRQALLWVALQNDFCSGRVLGVSDADRTIAV